MAKLTRPLNTKVSTEEVNEVMNEELMHVLEMDEESTVNFGEDTTTPVPEVNEVIEEENTNETLTVEPEIEELETKSNKKEEVIMKNEQSFADILREINANNTTIMETIKASCLDAAKKANATQTIVTLKTTKDVWNDCEGYVTEALKTLGLTLVLVDCKKELQITISW